MDELDLFRAECREWLDANCPDSMTQAVRDDEELSWGGRDPHFFSPDAQLWFERMVEKGWICPTWPREYGGAGLSNADAKTLRQELTRKGCRPALLSHGITMLGPVLLEFGTDEQKAEHLPKIARGEIRWCQGFSEPGAGSDLANVQCRATKQGENYIVSGQKIWTTQADQSDWIFCIVRTNPERSKHEGISFLLIDMQSDGVEATPIALLSGTSHFCQTFFDEVRVPSINLIGNEGQGWSIAKRLLQHERAMLSDSGGSSGGGEREGLGKFAKRMLENGEGVLSDSALRHEIAQNEMDRACYAATARRSAEGARSGRGPGPETSILKLYLSEWAKRRADLRVRIGGFQCLGWEGKAFTSDELDVTRRWLDSKAGSIAGGTSEIQLNIIAKRVLGLSEKMK